MVTRSSNVISQGQEANLCVIDELNQNLTALQSIFLPGMFRTPQLLHSSMDTLLWHRWHKLYFLLCQQV